MAPRIVGRRALDVGAADAFDTTLILLPLHRLVVTESVWRTAAERFWLTPSTAASTAPGTAAA